MATSAGKQAYRLRKQLVSSRSSELSRRQQGARRFLLRGLTSVAAEWTMLATWLSTCAPCWRAWRSRESFIQLPHGPRAPFAPLPDPNCASSHPSPILRHLQLSRQESFRQTPLAYSNCSYVCYTPTSLLGQAHYPTFPISTVRALLRYGCGDPRYRTVFHDQGAIGLPHPSPPLVE